MNYIITIARNNLHLTKLAVKSFRAQDIGDVAIVVIDNRSTDGTAEWLTTQQDILRIAPVEQWSVAQCWNFGLRGAFKSAEYALVVNNDVELRPDTYRLLVEDGGGFVTAVGTTDAEKIKPYGMGGPGTNDGVGFFLPDPAHKRPHPDFSCFLIRREVYEKVGPFNEAFKIAYCEDAEYHLRMHRAGIHAYCLDLPFLHHGAQTLKNASREDANRIRYQADVNRALFKQMFGFELGSPEYYAEFGHSAPEDQSGQ